MPHLHNARRFFYKALKQPGYAFQVFKKRLKAALYYIFANGKSSFPEAITLFLTHRCNLRCKMCGQWGEGGVTKKMPAESVRQELTFDELKNIIDDVSSFRPNITLFGGEPLLYSHCVELVQYIKDKQMHCLMITNGSLLEEFAQRLVEAGLDELNVSLDGDKELHDEIRGMPGLFERIANGLKAVTQLKRERGLKKPLINLQCTITKYNYKHLEKLLGVAKDLGADSLTYHNLIFLGADLIVKQKVYNELLACSSSDWEGFVFESQINPDALYFKIKEILKGNYPLDVDFYPNLSLKGLREYYSNPSYMPYEYTRRCLSPWIVAYIFPDGQVRPCLNFTYSYGNIKDDKFTYLWNNQQAIKYRQLLKQKQIFPVCVRCSELYRY